MTHAVGHKHGTARKAEPKGGSGARPKIADPVPNWRNHITSHVGHRKSPGGIGSTDHKGLDIGVPTGTPTQAVKDGKVVFAGNGGGYGNLVVIEHGDGTFTKYAHLSEINTQQGAEVKAGDVIGKVGSTGNSTGPHLHFEVRKGDYNNGAVLDPEAYLEGSESVAAGATGPGASYAGSAGGSSGGSSGGDAAAMSGGGGARSGMSLGGSSGGGGSAGSSGSAGAASSASSGGTPVVSSGSAVPSGNFAALLKKLREMGIDEEYLKELAEKHGVPLEMILGVIMQESGGNPNAKSPVGAAGLMQLMPATAAGLGVSNPLDPKQNVEGGVKYLGQMLKQFGGDTTKALAAYNAGPGNVQKYNGVPPFAETQKYVANITASLENAKSALA